MLETVREYVQKWQMLTSEDRVIVGVSGGADSICLLLVLEKLSKEMGFALVAVHVNHGLRGMSADADEAFVKNFCETRGIPCEIYCENVELIAKKRKQSTEEAGREVRKEFYQMALSKYNGTKIALAHHKNDNVETFFLNLSRGTGLKGLGGILPVNGKVIRPLLCVTREEIEAYLEEFHVSYCTDESNATDLYMRNRIRNHIIPYMSQEVNQRTVEHISETMEQIRQIQRFMEQETQKYHSQCVKAEKKGYLLREDIYKEIPEAIRPLLIKKVMTHLAKREKDIESIHLHQVDQMFGRQTGRKIDLPYDIEAKRTYEGVLIGLKKHAEEERKWEIELDLRQVPGIIKCENHVIQYNVCDKKHFYKELQEKNHTKCFDYDIIKDKLVIRTRRSGDYITIHPDGRTQKLKTFFINAKIPQEERDQIMLLAEGNHVLWVFGHRVNPLYRITENTNNILQICIDKGEE